MRNIPARAVIPARPAAVVVVLNQVTAGGRGPVVRGVVSDLGYRRDVDPLISWTLKLNPK